jgi:hypothetical protein
MSRQAIAQDDAQVPAAPPLPAARFVSLIGLCLAPAAELSIIVPTSMNEITSQA